MIEFCRCGSLMTPVKDGFRCRKCGAVSGKKADKIVSEKRAKDDIITIDDNAPDHLPVTDKECEKCGNKTAILRMKIARNYVRRV
ncbi:MAG: hypothetical protein HYW27_00895 [Candidatus Aenigmarchaeota archaeon]|nr:hypothetical protein [Candidatus Aenigmarchaeota archaeon]